uniref:Uncharacterized protein n=1 Tax=Chromera velia CCMP2878 TaxID=1169474 RepID=A0A0G4FPM6_9ALVE|eukprot:Cvel_3551.t1-p1 / transcript=Cvel_3551.t1 / gene=Cvel_3551 / organism=Chromera_velia_CCMP2878 / gene_product=hypothetical protein / transcript_product=hypothetical protein / location=Cvel_scaffold145:7687-13724(+) / protein_length=1345 / sequence_SO=supercontig / SO=protein_coding / is_pseudo=false
MSEELEGLAVRRQSNAARLQTLHEDEVVLGQHSGSLPGMHLLDQSEQNDPSSSSSGGGPGPHTEREREGERGQSRRGSVGSSVGRHSSVSHRRHRLAFRASTASLSDQTSAGRPPFTRAITVTFTRHPEIHFSRNATLLGTSCASSVSGAALSMARVHAMLGRQDTRRSSVSSAGAPSSPSLLGPLGPSRSVKRMSLGEEAIGLVAGNLVGAVEVDSLGEGGDLHSDPCHDACSSSSSSSGPPRMHSINAGLLFSPQNASDRPETRRRTKHVEWELKEQQRRVSAAGFQEEDPAVEPEGRARRGSVPKKIEFEERPDLKFIHQSGGSDGSQVSAGVASVGAQSSIYRPASLPQQLAAKLAKDPRMLNRSNESKRGRAIILKVRKAQKLFTTNDVARKSRGSLRKAARKFAQRASRLAEDLIQAKAATVIQKYWRLRKFRESFWRFSQETVGYVGSLGWLVHHPEHEIAMEAASVEEQTKWQEIKNMSPPDTLLDPFGYLQISSVDPASYGPFYVAYYGWDPFSDGSLVRVPSPDGTGGFMYAPTGKGRGLPKTQWKYEGMFFRSVQEAGPLPESAALVRVVCNDLNSATPVETELSSAQFPPERVIQKEREKAQRSPGWKISIAKTDAQEVAAELQDVARSLTSSAALQPSFSISSCESSVFPDVAIDQNPFFNNVNSPAASGSGSFVGGGRDREETGGGQLLDPSKAGVSPFQSGFQPSVSSHSTSLIPPHRDGRGGAHGDPLRSRGPANTAPSSTSATAAGAAAAAITVPQPADAANDSGTGERMEPPEGPASSSRPQGVAVQPQLPQSTSTLSFSAANRQIDPQEEVVMLLSQRRKASSPSGESPPQAAERSSPPHASAPHSPAASNRVLSPNVQRRPLPMHTSSMLNPSLNPSSLSLHVSPAVSLPLPLLPAMSPPSFLHTSQQPSSVPVSPSSSFLAFMPPRGFSEAVTPLSGGQGTSRHQSSPLFPSPSPTMNSGEASSSSSCSPPQPPTFFVPHHSPPNVFPFRLSGSAGVFSSPTSTQASTFSSPTGNNPWFIQTVFHSPSNAQQSLSSSSSTHWQNLHFLPSSASAQIWMSVQPEGVERLLTYAKVAPILSDTESCKFLPGGPVSLPPWPGTPPSCPPGGAVFFPHPAAPNSSQFPMPVRIQSQQKPQHPHSGNDVFVFPPSSPQTHSHGRLLPGASRFPPFPQFQPGASPVAQGDGASGATPFGSPQAIHRTPTKAPMHNFPPRTVVNFRFVPGSQHDLPVPPPQSLPPPPSGFSFFDSAPSSAGGSLEGVANMMNGAPAAPLPPALVLPPSASSLPQVLPTTPTASLSRQPQRGMTVSTAFHSLSGVPPQSSFS